jgi:hypothetical protein
VAEWIAWWNALGWRGWLLAAVILLGSYLVVVLLRLRRLGRPAPVKTVDARQEPVAEENSPEITGNAESRNERPAWNEPPPRFAERQIVLSLERQVIQLREELDALRGAFAALRDETQSSLEKSRRAQNISPIYGDAMQMALAGESAETIAGRCGVAMAEADLVVAMVTRAQGGLDSEGNDNQLALDGLDFPSDGRSPDDPDFDRGPGQYSEDERWLKS